MYSYKELRKAKKQIVNGKEIRLAVLGNSATQFLSTSIEGYAKMEGINLNVYDADYNQIDAQLLDPTSEVIAFEPQYILLWIAAERLYEEFLGLPYEKRVTFAEDYVLKLKNYWNLIRNNSKAKIIQTNITEVEDKVLGNLSSKINATFVYQIRKINYLLQEEMSHDNIVYPVDVIAIQNRMGRQHYFDEALYYNAKMNVSTSALPYVAAEVVKIIQACNGKIAKCLIMDLDNTIWGGVIGDDGPFNIEIGELGRGHAFSDFQRWIKQLKENGIILAVCSKNDEDIAKEPFEINDEMVLKLEDISVFVANWDDKATNIKSIQQTLNIGMDSIVFIDDNPFERNLVRNKLPEVTVPELPENPESYLQYMQYNNFFETASYTGKSADRTELYKAEYERIKNQKSFSTIDDYLEDLSMEAEMVPFDKASCSRIAQLTQRSNQFNLRTIRYSESDIMSMMKDDDYITYYLNLKDRFGDHGLVSVLILKKETKENAFIDTWLMSCRVLKRGAEEFVINKLVENLKLQGMETVTAEYIPTAKNGMVKDIYDKMGFRKIEPNNYILKLSDYKSQKTFIKNKGEK